jgi:hypothetical protein
MSSPPIKQLNGHDRYLRWKESILQRARTLGVADVICDKIPEEMSAAVITSSDDNGANMHLVWDVARRVVKIDPNPEHLWKKWNVDH